jgi:hypothetical protein
MADATRTMGVEITAALSGYRDGLNQALAVTRTFATELQRQLNALSAQAKAAFDKVGEGITGVVGKLVGGAHSTAELAGVVGKLVGGAHSTAGLDLGGLFAGFAGGAAIAGILKLLDDSDKSMVQLAKDADRASISIGKFQQLSYAASLAGVGSSDFAAALKKSADLIDEMGRKENDFSKLLDANGVKWKDSRGVILDTNSALSTTAELVRNAANYSQAVKIAEWAGYSEKMVPFLRQGSAAIAQMAKDAPVVSEELVRQRAEIEKNREAMFANLSARFKTWVVEVTGFLQPILDMFIKINAYMVNQLFSAFHQLEDKYATSFADRFGESLKQISRGGDTFTGAFKRAGDQAFASERGKTTKLIPEDESGDKTTALDQAQEAIRKRTAEYEAEAKAIGIDTAAKVRLKAIADQEDAARREGITLTKQQRDEINQLATAEGNAAQAAAAMKQRFSEMHAALQTVGAELTKVLDALEGFGSTGQSTAKRLQAAFKDIGVSLLRSSQQALLLGSGSLAGLFGTAAPAGSGQTGGLIGTLLNPLVKGFTGGYAAGGFVPSGSWGIVGEKGPEVVVGGSSGTSVLPGGMRGGDTTHNYYIDARGATGNAEVSAAINRGMAQAIAQAKADAPAHVARYNNRYG